MGRFVSFSLFLLFSFFPLLFIGCNIGPTPKPASETIGLVSSSDNIFSIDSDYIVLRTGFERRISTSFFYSGIEDSFLILTGLDGSSDIVCSGDLGGNLKFSFSSGKVPASPDSSVLLFGVISDNIGFLHQSADCVLEVHEVASGAVLPDVLANLSFVVSVS